MTEADFDKAMTKIFAQLPASGETACHAERTEGRRCLIWRDQINTRLTTRSRLRFTPRAILVRIFEAPIPLITGTDKRTCLPPYSTDRDGSTRVKVEQDLDDSEFVYDCRFSPSHDGPVFYLAGNRLIHLQPWSTCAFT